MTHSLCLSDVSVASAKFNHRVCLCRRKHEGLSPSAARENEVRSSNALREEKMATLQFFVRRREKLVRKKGEQKKERKKDETESSTHMRRNFHSPDSAPSTDRRGRPELGGEAKGDGQAGRPGRLAWLVSGDHRLRCSGTESVCRTFSLARGRGREGGTVAGTNVTRLLGTLQTTLRLPTQHCRVAVHLLWLAVLSDYYGMADMDAVPTNGPAVRVPPPPLNTLTSFQPLCAMALFPPSTYESWRRKLLASVNDLRSHAPDEKAINFR